MTRKWLWDFNRRISITTSKRALREGVCLHTFIIKTGIEFDILLMNNLLNIYAKCQSLEDAHKVFDKMSVRDVISWNTIVSAYSKYGHGVDALNFFCRMRRDGTIPNQFTFSSVIRACARLGIREKGKQIQAHVIITGFEHDIYVGSALVDMYVKNWNIDDARQVFDKMPMRDVIAFNTMISGYAQQGNSEDALQLFDQLKWVSISPDRITYASVLNALFTPEALERGRQVHAHIIKFGFESNTFVGTSLASMYAKCGGIEAARNVFYNMTEFDIVAWTIMITGYAQASYGWEALGLFTQMLQADMKPDPITFASALSACTNSEFLAWGKQLHAILMKSGYEEDFSIQCALVTAYSKCLNIVDACKVFDRIHCKQDIISWTTMLSGYVHNGCCEEALKLFSQMQKTGLKPDNVTIVSILSACTEQRVIKQGKQVHAHILKTGLEVDVSVGTTLLTMYADCRSTDDAQKVFSKMLLRDFVSWSAMIAGYAQQGFGEEALKLFCQMQQAGVKPNQFIFASVLMACTSLASLQQGKSVHGHIVKFGLLFDVFIGSALIDMYAKCGSIEYAKLVFDKMSQVDTVLWNSMIAGYCHHGHGSEALELFKQMQHEGIHPDHITFVSVLSAFSHVGLVDDGCYCFDSMSREHGITPRMEHYACMVDLLGRAGLLKEAVNFIKVMPFKPGTVVLRALLGACRIYGNTELGKHVAECLLENNPEDTATYVLLSNIYAAAGSWDEAVKVRRKMKDKGLTKDPGSSWIEVKNRVQVFVAGDAFHP